MTRSAQPGRLAGRAAAPPSKSVLIRAVAAACLARGTSTLRVGGPLCADARAALEGARALGATVEAGLGALGVHGLGGTRPAPRAGTLPCGESALCLRAFAPVACQVPGRWTLTASGTLARRPVHMISAPLRALGAHSHTAEGRAPVIVEGPLRGGSVEVDASETSQVLTGLLVALAAGHPAATVRPRGLVSGPYVDLTLQVLRAFGARIERHGEDLHVPGGGLEGADLVVEGDWSAAAFLLVAGAIAGRVEVTGLSPASVQPDRAVLEVLRAAGARVEGTSAAQGELRAFHFDGTHAPDLLLPLAALAACIPGESTLAGVARLRHKESDRAEAIARVLQAVGAHVDLVDDTLRIRGGALSGGVEVDAGGDHRVAMLAAVVALRCARPVHLRGADAVDKSWPGFFDDLDALRQR